MNKEHVAIRMWLPRENVQDILDYRFWESSKADNRLRFVLSRYDGRPVRKICEEMGISIQTGYNWQNEWNRSGTGSLDGRKQTGRPSQIDEETMKYILKVVDLEHMTTGQARSLIKDRCGIEFSKKHVRTILRRNGFIHPEEYLKGLTKSLFPEYRDRKEKPWITKETLTVLVFGMKRPRWSRLICSISHSETSVTVSDIV